MRQINKRTSYWSGKKENISNRNQTKRKRSTHKGSGKPERNELISETRRKKEKKYDEKKGKKRDGKLRRRKKWK